MQAILATRKDDELQSIADRADRIHEVNRSLVLVTRIAATGMESPLVQQIEALTKQVAILTTQMTSMAKELRRARGRSRSRDRARSKTPDGDSICFYYRRFGAKKCTKPCMYHRNDVPGRSLAAKNESNPRPCRLYMTDRHTQTKYLIDTGSDVSVFPNAMAKIKKRPDTYEYAANGTKITTYGRRITLQPR